MREKRTIRAAGYTLAFVIGFELLSYAQLFGADLWRTIVGLTLIIQMLTFAFRGGVRPGMASAIMGTLYLEYMYTRFPRPFATPAETIRQDILVALFFPGLAYVVGYLRERVERLLSTERELRGRAEEANHRLRDLLAVTDTALARSTSGELLDGLLDRVREILGVDFASIFLMREDGQTLAARASKGLEEELAAQYKVTSGEGFIGRIAAERRSLTSQEADTSEAANPFVRARGTQSVAGTPLIVEGRLIGVLRVGSIAGRVFTEDEMSLMERVADRAAMALDVRRGYERDHKIAETLQRAFLPGDLPRIPGLSISAVYRPGASEAGIGGDWYDAFHLFDGRIALTIGDVSGRGLQAAVAMGQIRQGLRAAALENIKPSSALTRVSQLLQLDQRGALATAIYGILDPVAMTLTYATAGHPPPVLATPDGRVEGLPFGGVALGMAQREDSPEWTVPIPPGAMLLLYSDGLIEFQRNVTAGEATLFAALRAEAAAPSENPAGAVMERVLAGHQIGDDIAVLLVSMARAPLDRFTLTVPAIPASLPLIRQSVRQLSRALALDKEQSFGVEVAVGEAVSNVIEHAYAAAPGFIKAQAWRAGDDLIVEIGDEGRWRAERNEGRGRGLQIMRALVDAVEVSPASTGTIVRITRRLNGPREAVASHPVGKPVG